MHEPDRTYNHAAELMSVVRFQLIDVENIEEITRIDYMNEDHRCMKLIMDAQRYHMLPKKQPLFAAVLPEKEDPKPEERKRKISSTQADCFPGAQIRSTEPVLVALGGKQSTNQVSNSVQFLCSRKKRWQPLTTMPTAAYCHCVAVFNDFLFVAGGQEHFDNNGNTALSSCFRYDPRSNKWIKLKSMLEPRTDFHLSAFDEKSLIAVAGRNQNGPLNSCERYYVGLDKWEKITLLPISVCAHAGATLNNSLYIAGGFAADGFQRGCYKLTKVIRQETSTSSNTLSPRSFEDFVWEKKASLNIERGLHCMVQIKGKLYAIGGNNKSNGYRRDVINTDMYDPEIDKWNVINPLFEGQSEAGASVVGDKIYWIPFLGLGLRNCAQKETQKSNFFQKFRKPPLLMSLEAIPGVNAKTCKLSLATTLIKKTGRVITIFQRL